MKKILTLFCSLVAAAMLFAAPQIKLAPMSPATDTKLHPQVLHALPLFYIIAKPIHNLLTPVF